MPTNRQVEADRTDDRIFTVLLHDLFYEESIFCNRVYAVVDAQRLSPDLREPFLVMLSNRHVLMRVCVISMVSEENFEVEAENFENIHLCCRFLASPARGENPTRPSLSDAYFAQRGGVL